ncbi:YceI family protein [Pendulispora albinea]|uniref:YceI family protein n=1 Tax=Pendulispora albinea TaxID=2741071 RepID=A0ABZ2LQK9_9BACT
MKYRLAFVAAALTLAGLSAACDNDPGKDKAKAQVAAPGATVAQPVAAGAATKYAFSSADGSKFSFVGAKVTRKHDGSFGTFSGTIQLVDNNPEKSSVSADIDIGSMATDTDQLTGHLKTADFFDVAKFPKAHFTSTAIRAGGEKGATHTVTGNLELHGVTKALTFPATIRVNGDNVEADAEFAINRKDFGLVYPGKPDDLIKDEVLIKLAIRAKKAAS